MGMQSLGKTRPTRRIVLHNIKGDKAQYLQYESWKVQFQELFVEWANGS